MTWLQIVIILPLVMVILAMTATIVRRIARVWLDHHVKQALLEQLERKPGLLRSMDALEELLDTSPGEEEAEGPLDFTLTGAILTGIGLLCAVLGALFSGRQAVGVYIGGVICVVLGFILVVVGLAIRFLARAPVERRPRGWRRWKRD